MSFTVAQCRAARGLLNWSAQDLATAAAVGVASVRRFEGGETVQGDTIAKIIAAFEQNGIVVIEQGVPSKAGGSGVRFLNDPRGG